MHRDHRDILHSCLRFTRRLKRYLVRAFIDEMSIHKIQAMFLEVGLALGPSQMTMSLL